MGHDQMIVQAVGGGNLELSQFLPLVADSLLTSLDLLAAACDIFARHCVDGIEADEHRCRRHTHDSTTLLTALVERIGYDAAEVVPARLPPAVRPAKRPAAGDRARTVDARGVRRTRRRPSGSRNWDRRRQMQTAPKGLRLHIGLFGRRNAGKSSLLNAMTRQEVSIVSEVAGTTTDPVEKPMELLPLGPVLFIDTAGIDDEGALGEKRVQKTRQVFDRTDVGVLVVDAGRWDSFEEAIFAELTGRGVPVHGGASTSPTWPGRRPRCCSDCIRAEGRCSSRRSPTSGAASSNCARRWSRRRRTISCARRRSWPTWCRRANWPCWWCPIDLEAPKGRLILPQVQTIRDLLDGDAYCMVVKERELRDALGRLNRPPALVVTDSQAFLKVAADTPPDGEDDVVFDPVRPAEGRPAPSSSRVRWPSTGSGRATACWWPRPARIIPIGDDIGRVKIPRWLTQYVGGELRIDTTQGHDFPEDLAPTGWSCIAGRACGTAARCSAGWRAAARPACRSRNYGMTIAYTLGIFERALGPFPDALETYRELAT